jgi:hypothetical protein
VISALLVILAMLLLLQGLGVLLLRVRADHDAKIAEHWRRNGREWPGKDW